VLDDLALRAAKRLKAVGFLQDIQRAGGYGRGG
jgi:hypothetical protein